MKIRRSYSVDEDVYEKFLAYAKQNSINISQFIQNAMKNAMAKKISTCDYCGNLQWTIDKWGVVVHKEACPHRTEKYHQGNPPKEE